MAIRVAVIGAGSIGFTRRLMQDILSVPELGDTQFRFMDISKRNLDMMTQLAKRDIKANGLGATVTATTERRRALDGADYVINCTRIGGLEAFATDVDIPLKYGVDQCVGDTLCAGGILYGQRNIPQILAFCKDIREVADGDVWFLNYANPNAMNTWAANQYGKVRCVGLCHGVQGGHHQIAEVIQLMVNGSRKPEDPKYRKVTMKDVDIVCAGINHQTWYVKVLFDGEDWSQRLLPGFEAHPVYSKTEKVRIDILKRFGYYTTESNGHVSEYLSWYRKRPDEIPSWIDMREWIHGETGGYLRVCTEERNWFVTDFPRWIKGEAPKYSPQIRSIEHGSWIIEALETGRVYRGHFNVVNNGAISNLPPDCVVEVPGYVDKNGMSIPPVGDLPLGCAAICSNSIQVQRLAVEAAVHGDVFLLKQAMLLDPLVGAVCTPPEASQMTDEMLIAQEKWLPQYKTVLPEVKKRFAAEKKLGTRVTRGAARVQVKTVAQLAAERGEGAGARPATDAGVDGSPSAPRKRAKAV